MIVLNVWDSIVNFFSNFGNTINNWFKDTFKFDDLILGGYNEFISPVAEIFKWLGLVFVGIILVLGIISFIKKFIKLFIVLVVIFLIIIIVTKFL
jgi:hypothetical protein